MWGVGNPYFSIVVALNEEGGGALRPDKSGSREPLFKPSEHLGDTGSCREWGAQPHWARPGFKVDAKQRKVSSQRSLWIPI